MHPQVNRMISKGDMHVLVSGMHVTTVRQVRGTGKGQTKVQQREGHLREGRLACLSV